MIGLDIGSSSIKIAEVESSNKGINLKKFGILPTPGNSVSEGNISNVETLKTAVQELIAKLKLKKQKVSVGLWGSSVIVKRITIPQMDRELITEQIQWEAEQYIPYEISSVNMDFIVLDKFVSSPDVIDILLIGAIQDSVFKYREVATLSEVDCATVDVEGFALANCFNRCKGLFPGKAIVLLNIGAVVTNFVIIFDGEVIFSRDIPAGGEIYTREISQGMSLNWNEAESLKLGISIGEKVPEEALSIIEKIHKSIIDEVSGMMHIFSSTVDNVSLGKVYVTGGTVRTPGLMSSFAQNFEVERFDPISHIKVNSKNLSPEFVEHIRDVSALAIGLGLRKVGDV